MTKHSQVFLLLLVSSLLLVSDIKMDFIETSPPDLSFTNTSKNMLWKTGLLQMHNSLKTIESYDNRRESSDIKMDFKEIPPPDLSFTNNSKNSLWKNGLLQMYNFLKPIEAYDNRREPNFVTFNSRDSEVGLDLNLAFPIIRIPVVNTSNILDLAKDFQRRERPLINFDLNGIVMVSMITVISTAFSVMLRTFFRPFASQKKVKEKESRSILDDTDTIRTTYNTLKGGLLKYGFNAHECVQRMVCGIVKNAMHDRQRHGRSASHFSRIIEGLTRSDWALKYIENTTFVYAIDRGRSLSDCHRTFLKCNSNSWFERVMKMVVIGRR